MPKRRIYKRDKLGRFASTGAAIPRYRYTGKTMTLYHRTSPWAAGRILQRGFITGRGRGFQRLGETEVFASNLINGQAEGYGTSILRIRVKRKHAILNDEFPSGERHYAIDPTHIKRSSIRVLGGKKAMTRIRRGY